MIGDGTPMRRLALFNKAEKGRHVEEPEVEVRTARRFTLTAQAPFRFEADGDLYETAVPVLDLEVLPGALQVIRG